MPVDLQIVAPSSGARNQFGLRGGLGMQLDETISPIVQAAEPLTDYPWRIDGIRWWHQAAPVAVIGQGALVVVTQPAKASTLVPDIVFATLDYVAVRNSSGAAVANGAVGYFNGVGANVPTFTFEGLGTNELTTGTPLLGTNLTAAAAGVARRVLTFTVPITTTLFIQLPGIPVVTGDGAQQGVGVFMEGSLNFAYDITLSGRVWYKR